MTPTMPVPAILCYGGMVCSLLCLAADGTAMVATIFSLDCGLTGQRGGAAAIPDHAFQTV
jgi:hypothetical protein